MPSIHRIERRAPDDLVLTVAERLYVDQPHLDVLGLYAIGERYFIICGNLADDAKSWDGLPVSEWLLTVPPDIRPPIELVVAPPVGAREIPRRGISAAIELRGVERIARDVFADLALALGPQFPSFTLHERGHLDWEMHVSESMSVEQLATIDAAFDALGTFVALTVVHPSIRESSTPSFYRFPQGDLTLPPARTLHSDTPAKVRQLVEADEEFWVANRSEAFLGRTGLPSASMLPTACATEGLKCVVDATTFPPANIRGYLTLFDTVYVCVPLAATFDAALASFDITAPELTELLGAGRVKLLLPQPIDRYPIDWLAGCVDIAPDAIVASRQLACAQLVDTRTRMPFLHPPLDLDERRELLRQLDATAANEQLPDLARRWFRVIARECRTTWAVAPLAVQREGAMQTSRFGMGWLASQLHTEFTGQERIVEIMGAARVVEFASFLGAHACPSTSETYSDDAACHVVAALSSPIDGTGTPVADARVHGVVEGLLAIDGNVPVVEFARAFRGPDVDRFREFARTLSRWNQDDEQLAGEVERFNRAVRRYEQNPNRLRTANITGLVTGVAGEVAPHLPHGLSHLPLGLWLLGVMIGVGAEPSPKGRVLGRLWDHANGLLARTDPRAVLVSRLCQQVRMIKS